MKTIIILFFISSFAFCQDINHIKTLDTVYVAFTKGKNLEKKIYSDNFREYTLSLNSKKENRTEQLLFSKPDRKNSMSEKGSLRIDTRIENKSFLKKHQKDIIDLDFLKNFTEEYIVCELLSRSQTFYIIDLTEKKKRKVVLYSVFLLNYCPIGE